MTDDQDATQPEPAPHIDPPAGEREDGSGQQDAARGVPLAAGPGGEPIVTEAQAKAPSLAAASPDASPAAPAETLAGKVLERGWSPSGSKVTIAPVPPLESVTLPPLEDGGEGLVIPAEGAEVDAATAERALQVATEAGFRLQEL
jgi:hypothetical protein